MDNQNNIIIYYTGYGKASVSRYMQAINLMKNNFKITQTK
jgi:hypothetical protein